MRTIPMSKFAALLGALLLAAAQRPYALSALHEKLLQPPFPVQAAQSLSAAGATELRGIIQSGHLPDLRWPNFTDYRVHVGNFYQSTGESLAWIRAMRPTQQAQILIQLLEEADDKGLHQDDYDGFRWAGRLAKFQSSPSESDVVHFDVALTICVMRYVSALHVGRVNPSHLGFELDSGRKKYNLPELLRLRLMDVSDPKLALAEIEPPFAGYYRAQDALRRYIELSRQDDGEKLPETKTLVDPGETYVSVARLARLLKLLGDLPAGVNVSADNNSYQGVLVDAVKRFQARHGLETNGRIGPQTIKQLNTPLRDRILQLQLTLERWRWLPARFSEPPVIVNIPEFRLRALDAKNQIALSMNVVVGKSFERFQTPVFDEGMKYVVFRPYWNVPPSIQRNEIVPAVVKNREYLVKNQFEVVTPGGQLVTDSNVSDEVLAGLRAGKFMIRQKPGPKNSLGLVKLIFPNAHNVYLHSTPAQELFSRSRRDFSHGCIRVEEPAELTAWVLRENPGWSLERVREAMESGKDNAQVNLTRPIPVIILYGTAVVPETGDVEFFDDIYGHDATLKKALAKGYPYPN
jgi:murein L,D-transpeptidase YcbB/YkuD